MNLGDLALHQAAIVIRIAPTAHNLREIGFAEGDEVEIIHMDLSKQTIAVRVNRTAVGMKRVDANKIKVTVL